MTNWFNVARHGLRVFISYSVLAAVLLSLFAPAAEGAAPPSIKGKWHGTIKIKNSSQQAEFDVNYTTQTGTAWTGVLTVQGVKVQLTGTISETGKVTGAGNKTYLGVPVHLTFTGQLSADKNAIKGNATATAPGYPTYQGAYSMSRTSPILPPNIKGNWNGTLTIKGQKPAAFTAAISKQTGAQWSGTITLQGLKLPLTGTVTTDGKLTGSGSTTYSGVSIKVAMTGQVSSDAKTITGPCTITAKGYGTYTGTYKLTKPSRRSEIPAFDGVDFLDWLSMAQPED